MKTYTVQFKGQRIVTAESATEAANRVAAYAIGAENIIAPVITPSEEPATGSIDLRKPPVQQPANNVIACPQCGSHTVRMVDSQPLSNEPYDGQPFMLDSQAYADVKCDTCGHKTCVKGSIQWEQPAKVESMAFARIWGNWNCKAELSFESEVDIATNTQIAQSHKYSAEHVKMILALRIGESLELPYGNHKIMRIS